MRQYSEADKRLIWTVGETKTIATTPIFDLLSTHETATNGVAGDYISMKARDWVMTIPVIGDDFVMVRQWRHALRELTTEFPGGVSDGGEDMAESALRELEEETGYRAGRITKLGQVNPNPALFGNTFHVFLAEDLVQTGELHLDHDELLDVFRIPIKEVIDSFGSEGYVHGLMGTALAFYLRHIHNNY